MVGEWSQRPMMRAADVDREYAMGLLRNASVDGQLTREEFDERLEQAMHAKTLGELATLVGDLQTPAHPQTRHPQRPQPYAQLPAPPYPRKKRRGVVAFVATAAALLAIGVALDSADEPPAPDIGTEVVLPERELSGLAPTGAYDRNLADLGLPATLPIVRGADFDGGTTLQAGNDGAKTTYRWHLEYKLSHLDSPILAADVAQFYRENVHSQQFGESIDAQQPAESTTELRWTDALHQRGPADYTLQVRTTDLDDAVRVELDVTTAISPMRSVPDVPGDLALQLRNQDRVTAGTMRYESSRIAQPVGGGTTCLVEQEWSATASDYYALEAKFKEVGASATELDDRWYVRFSETRTDCGALAF
jgi:hypothetical protein